MNGASFCITAKVSSAQQVGLITKYVKAHPGGIAQRSDDADRAGVAAGFSV